MKLRLTRLLGLVDEYKLYDNEPPADKQHEKINPHIATVHLFNLAFCAGFKYP